MAHLKPSKHKETISGSSLSLSATLNAANNGVHATYMRKREDDREDERKVRERRGQWRREGTRGRHGGKKVDKVKNRGYHII